MATELKQELMRVRREARELYSRDQVEEAVAKVAIKLAED
jgi:hypoxanthine phosphoribosyltransferase